MPRRKTKPRVKVDVRDLARKWLCGELEAPYPFKSCVCRLFAIADHDKSSIASIQAMKEIVDIAELNQVQRVIDNEVVLQVTGSEKVIPIDAVNIERNTAAN